MSEGVRQEGQQWGDEHGVEVDGSSVGSVEILKGPASLMYGSDAMAGVVILHAQPTLAEGELKGNISTEYQTNNGLFNYSLQMAGNQKGFVWDARYSDKMAHAYKNKYDGYVPGSQFRERAGRLMLGLNKGWGHSRLTWTAYHLTPGIVEGVEFYSDRVASRESLGSTRLEAFLFGVTVKLTHHVFDADSQHHLAVFAPLDELPRRRPER